jgi:hypothetical protein
LNGTVQYYKFDWIKRVVQIDNFYIKEIDPSRTVTSFDVVLYLESSQKDIFDRMKFKDYKSTLEIIFSFCEPWFGYFKVYDAVKISRNEPQN